MNRVTLLGRVTKDIELRYAGDTAVAKFTLAVNRKKDEADFINCVAFGKNAEGLNKYTGKGKRLAVEGHIQTGSYQRQDGITVYTTDVIVDRQEYIDFAEKKADEFFTPSEQTDEFFTPPEQMEVPWV